MLALNGAHWLKGYLRQRPSIVMVEAQCCEGTVKSSRSDRQSIPRLFALVGLQARQPLSRGSALTLWA